MFNLDLKTIQYFEIRMGEQYKILHLKCEFELKGAQIILAIQRGLCS